MVNAIDAKGPGETKRSTLSRVRLVVVRAVGYFVATPCPWLSASLPRRLPCICCRRLRWPGLPAIPALGKKRLVRRRSGGDHPGFSSASVAR